MDNFQKAAIVYDAMEKLLPELEGKAHDALDEFIVTASITTFARLYDILQEA